MFFRDFFKISLFLLPLLIVFALVVVNSAWDVSLVYFAAACFLWAVAYPYITQGLDGKLVDFIYYSLAIIGIVLLAQGQLNERAVVDAEYELSETVNEVALMKAANSKFKEFTNSFIPSQQKQYIDDWTDNPFVSIETGLIELEYWLDEASLELLASDSQAAIAAMSRRMKSLTDEAEQEYNTAKQAVMTAKTKQSAAGNSSALLTRVIELNVWPYLMCLAFALKIARKRIV